MVDPDGYGCGQQHMTNRGDGHCRVEGSGDGDGSVCLTQQVGGYSWGDGWGCGTRGDGFGGGYGDAAHCTHSDAPYATPLVIDTDPITTAYQAATMQTLGEHRV